MLHQFCRARRDVGCLIARRSAVRDHAGAFTALRRRRHWPLSERRPADILRSGHDAVATSRISSLAKRLHDRRCLTWRAWKAGAWRCRRNFRHYRVERDDPCGLGSISKGLRSWSSAAHGPSAEHCDGSGQGVGIPAGILWVARSAVDASAGDTCLC